MGFLDGGTERALILTKQGGRVGSFSFFLGAHIVGGQVFLFFLWARNLVLKIHHVIVKILVLLDHVWRQHFRELVVLETTPQEFLFS